MAFVKKEIRYHMITVNFVRGKEIIPVQVDTGRTLMEAAKFYSNGTVDEITADCGGSCACGTCHVYIQEPWASKIEPASTDTPEIELLEYEEDYQENISRLACQIELNESHEGLVAHLRK